MKWNGKNYRPSLGVGSRSAQPQTYSIGSKRMVLKKTIFMGAGFDVTPIPSPTPSPSITPTPSPTLTPTPTPSPIVYSVSITPSSVEEFDVVSLSGSTNLTSPTFVWSLNNFRDVSGNTISSYTGNTLIDGYFTSSGSDNISLLAIGNEGSATTTTFNVTEIEYILDTFTGASFAFEGRKLSSSSTKAYRVRRSSDNDETDIGFSGNELDTASLLSFVGTGATDNGFVVRFYDQSGNGKDLFTTTASFQPTIVSNGVLVENNGLVGSFYDGSNTRIVNTTMSFTGKDMDIFSVAKRDPSFNGVGTIIGGDKFKIDVRDNGSAQFDSGGPNFTGDNLEGLYKSGITTSYFRREEFNHSIFISGDYVIPEPSSAWSAATTTDLTDVTTIIIGRRLVLNDLRFKGWSYAAIGYNQRSPQNLIDAVQANQAKYYLRPSIIGDTTPTINTNYDYSVEDGIYFSAATYNWDMGDTWVGNTTGRVITGFFSATTETNISVINSSSLVTLSASKTINPTP